MNKEYVLVFGACSLDRFFPQQNDGEYPSNPSFCVPGGKGSNQAVACARAGENVKIITRLGNDETGKEILKNLKNNKVDTSCVELIENLSNDIGNIRVSVEGDNYITRQTGASESFTEDMIEKYADIIKGAKMVIAQMKIPKNVSKKLVDFCFKNNIPIVLTPCKPEKLDYANKEDKAFLDKLTYITCNEKEAQIIFKSNNLGYIAGLYPDKIIITRGKNGLIFNDGKYTVEYSAIDVEKVIDTTGAGDTLCGNFVASIQSGKSFNDSIFIGMAAATLKILKKSAQAGMPYKKELNEFLNKLGRADLI